MTLADFARQGWNRPRLLAGLCYGLLVAAVFAWAAYMRYRLPQQPFIDGDFWGYLQPAISKLNGGEFQHKYGRDSLYPGFLYLLLKSSGDFRTISVVQHLFGLGTGALMLLAYERFCWILLYPARHSVYGFLLRLLGLVPATAFLLAPSAVYFEQCIRPEGIFPFFAVLSIWLNLEFIRRRWVEPQPRAAWIGAVIFVLSLILYKLKPGFGFGVVFVDTPLAISLLMPGLNWRQKVYPLGAAAIFAALALVLPESRLRATDPAAPLILPDLLYTIHADMIHDQLREDLASGKSLPYPRPLLEKLYQRLDEVLPLSKEPGRNVYPTLGFDPDYLLFVNCVFEPMLPQSKRTRALRGHIGLHYYIRTATHQPWRMLGKIRRQLEQFYRFEPYIGFKFSGPFPYYYHHEFARPLAAGYGVNIEISKPDWLRSTLELYAPARTFLAESGQLTTTTSEIQPFALAASLQFLCGTLYLPGLLAVLATCGWTLSSSRRRRRWLIPTLLVLLIYGYNFGNDLTVAIIHSLDVGRYIDNQFAYTLLACLLGVVFVSEVVRDSAVRAFEAAGWSEFFRFRPPSGRAAFLPLLPRLAPSAKPPSLGLLLICSASPEANARLEKECREAFPDAPLQAANFASDTVPEGDGDASPGINDCLGEIGTDLVLLADASRTYSAEMLRALWQSYLDAPVDLIIGALPMSSRLSLSSDPRGSWYFKESLRWVFGWEPEEVFSGPHLLSRRFYENILLCSRWETLPLELALHARSGGFSTRKFPLPLPTAFDETPCPEVGRDPRYSWRTLESLLMLGFDFQPMRLLRAFAVGFLLLGVMIGYSPLHHLGDNHHHFSRALQTALAGSMLVAALLSLQAGVILESRLRHDRKERQLRIRRSHWNQAEKSATD